MQTEDEVRDKLFFFSILCVIAAGKLHGSILYVPALVAASTSSRVRLDEGQFKICNFRSS